MKELPELELELQDTQWPFEGTDHEREIVRAIVFDSEGYLYFARALRDDVFGKAVLIETSGGGVEKGEAYPDAMQRELREELGAEVEIICKIGVVRDFYNLIHRRNLNHYYLCRLRSFGESHQTPEEIEHYHLSALKLRPQEAWSEYQKCAETPIGTLIANRELPVLERAWELLEAIDPAHFRREADEAPQENLSYEEKNYRLFLRQKAMLERFLQNGAIGKAQYEKSMHDLEEKTGYGSSGV